jgi:CshA-type fibril repeat protein
VKSLRRLCTGAIGAVVGITSIIVVPLAAAGPAAASDGGPASCTPDAGYTNCVRYTFTGDDQAFMVPASVTAIRAKIWGAGGGGSQPSLFDESGGGGGGGGGGFTTGTLAVSSGQSLTLMVGQGGRNSSGSSAYGGGATAGFGEGFPWGTGGSGGGMSALFVDAAHTVPLLIAGGGGGVGGSSDRPGNDFEQAGGGGGGGDNGLASVSGDGRGGTGATQAQGGSGGRSLDEGCFGSGNDGTQFSGGAGAVSFGFDSGGGGGGGGGGYFGGGGGACADTTNFAQGRGGSGGGGSAFIAELASDATTSPGATGAFFFQSAAPGGAGDPLYDPGTGTGGTLFSGGNGEIVLEWVGAPAPAAVTTSGTGPATQSPTISVPDGGSLRLVNGDGDAVTSLAVDGEGTYTVDTDANTLAFTPAAHFAGAATPVKFRVTDSSERSGDATYTPTVNTPDAPAPAPLASNGTGTDAETATAIVPDDGSVTLLDSAAPTDTVTVPDQGTYTLDPQTGVITFAPVLGFSGAATAVTYQLTDSYSSTGSSTYTPTVAKPAAPTVPEDPQAGVDFNHTDSLTVPIPAGGHIELLNETSPNTFVSVQGATWALDPDTGVITFTPAQDEAGSAGLAYYDVTDAYGQQTQGSYTAYLRPPAAPQPQPLTSVGNPNTAQVVSPVIPSGGSAQFIVDELGDPHRVVVPEGVYTMDQSTYAITFTPNAGFVGTPTPVSYRLNDAYSQHADSSYQPQVVAAPLPTSVNTSGRAGSTQHQQVPVPPGGSVMLLDGATPVTSIPIPGQGTYSVDPQTGMLTFAPAAGFVGKARSVTYRVTDGFGRHADAAYTATVLATGVATATAPSLVTLATKGTTVPVTCKVSVGNVARCEVTLTYRLNGRAAVVGTGTVSVRGAGAPRQVVVPIQLNALGHFLAGALGGVPSAVSVSLSQVGNPSALHAATTTRFVNASVKAPQAVYFDSGSAALRPADMAYLNSLRSKLSGVRSITCTGNADNTSGWFTNWLLGASRAASACNYLTRGTLIRKIYVTNGSRAPDFSDSTAHGRQLNRRTDIRMDY